MTVWYVVCSFPSREPNCRWGVPGEWPRPAPVRLQRLGGSEDVRLPWGDHGLKSAGQRSSGQGLGDVQVTENRDLLPRLAGVCM